MGVEHISGHGYGVVINNFEPYEQELKAVFKAMFPTMDDAIFDKGIAEIVQEDLVEELAEMNLEVVTQGNFWSDTTFNMLILLKDASERHPDNDSYIQILNKSDIRNQSRDGLMKLLVLVHATSIPIDGPTWVVYTSVI